MKTKTLFVGIIALALSVLLPSCGVLEDPDTWAVEIEDSYRTQVALAFGYAVYDEKSVDAFAEKLDAEAEKANDESDILDGDCPKFKIALEKMAKEDEMAADILDGYNKLEVKFSKWAKQPKEDGFSIWTATEENSGVKVTFKNNSMLEWDLDLDEETLVAYFENIAATLGGGTSTLDEDDIEDAIKQRIEAQYESRMPDNKIMSKAFYSIFSKAQQADDSELGWPDWDYWECTQGAYAELASVKVEVISEVKAIAHIILHYPENGDNKKVDMPMVYENNNWYVDDIISYDEDGKYSLRKAAMGN